MLIPRIFKDFIGDVYKHFHPLLMLYSRCKCCVWFLWQITVLFMEISKGEIQDYCKLSVLESETQHNRIWKHVYLGTPTSSMAVSSSLWANVSQSDNGDFNLPQQGNSEARVWILLYVFEEIEQLLLALYLVIFQVMWVSCTDKCRHGNKNLKSGKKSETCDKLRCWICNQPPVRFQSSFQLRFRFFLCYWKKWAESGDLEVTFFWVASWPCCLEITWIDDFHLAIEISK